MASLRRSEPRPAMLGWLHLTTQDSVVEPKMKPGFRACDLGAHDKAEDF